MNWKDEAIEKLQRYKSMSHAVKSIPMELTSLDLEARAIQALSPEKLRSKAHRGQEDRLMSIMVKRQELEQLLDNAESWISITDAALRQLPENEKQLLTMLYIEKKDPRYICMQENIDRSCLYRRRDTALRTLTLAMYGALES